MFYGSTTRATDFGPDPWQVRALHLVFFFIRPANPDNEKLYGLVKKWYIELDDAGLPVREIGIGLDEEPLFVAPDDRNVGFWTGMSDPVSKDELTQISAEEFERSWSEFQIRKET